MSFSFNPDGSLNMKPRTKRDHLPLLLALEEVPFGMGKKLLSDHLRGRENTKTLKLRLDKYTTFGDLGGYEEEDVRKLIGHLEARGLITIRKEQGRYPVYTLTKEGAEELETPKEELDLNDLERAEKEHYELQNPFKEKTIIKEQDKRLFEALGPFLEGFNDEQKKAVTSPERRILCVAGAGSGKTSVLTRRIAFLAKYRSVPQEKILAITFTRKARREMQARLEKLLPAGKVRVETFNSYAEKTLQEHGGKLYGKPVRMASFKEHYQSLIELLKRHGETQGSIVERYFTGRQRNGKDAKTLFFSFAYDFQALLDKLRITDTAAKDLKDAIKDNRQHAPLAKLLLDLAQDYHEEMERRGLRDYTGQLVDTIRLYEKHQNTIPQYEHVLVDEYQDVNDQQLRLLQLIKPNNLFVVGDPRQSIYGWRGSKMQHIIDFSKEEEAQTLQLTKNYRSAKEIVSVCNDVIRKTGYADLEAASKGQGKVTIIHHANEEEQARKVARTIKDYEGDRKDVFVLARTNKALEAYQQRFRASDIDYLLRTDELKRTSTDPATGQVTLATIHAIKGLEARQVHVVQANNNNFPCKASDHPVMDLFGLQEDYDSNAEELRVLYVALSRAKEELHIHYTGTPSSFLPSTILPAKKQRQTTLKTSTTADNAALMRLRRWRYQKAKEQGVPAYVICPDKTLHALIQQRPASEEELQDIPGLGQARIREYAEELLGQL